MSKQKKTIQSIERAIKILNLFKNNHNQKLGLSEISIALNLNKTTAYHLIYTLETNGYLEKDCDSNKYQLGLELFSLGNLVGDSINIRTKALPCLKQIVNRYNDTVHLAILKDNQVFYIEKEEGTMAIRISSQLGRTKNLHCTGVGKALMAHLDESSINKIIKEIGLPKYTSFTINHATKLKKELSKIRNQGYAIDNQEVELGLRCIAAPIKNHTNDVVAAISISGPTSRIKIDDKTIIADIKNAALKISHSVGYNENSNI